MTTTAKSKKAPVKKQVSSTKSKGVVASKKKGLNRKQWSVIAVVGVVVLAIGGYLGLQAYQNSTSDAASCVSKTFKKGSSGSCVKYIQILANYRFNMNAPKHAKLAVDGKFGSGTKSAIQAFQKDYKLSADGIVGKKTWWGLCQTGAATRGSDGKIHAVMVKGFPVNEARAAGCQIYW